MGAVEKSVHRVPRAIPGWMGAGEKLDHRVPKVIKALREMLANLLISVRHLHQRRPHQVLIFRHCILPVMVIFILVHHYYIYLMEQNGRLMEVYYLARATKAMPERMASRETKATRGSKVFKA